jgi:nicotinate-nucleotide--dimethylbenzimidazole phosphoribosyltransferase
MQETQSTLELTLPKWAVVPKISTDFDNPLIHAINQKTKPIGSLGQLEVVAYQCGRIQQSLKPSIQQPVLLVFAGDHGIAQNPGVSAYPSAVTPQMVMNFANQGAAVNVFAKQHGWKLDVIDVGVNALFEPELQIQHAKVVRGSQNSLVQSALEPDEVLECLDVGYQMVQSWLQKDADVFACGEMGIGNTASSSLILSAMWNLPISTVTGRGTGVLDLEHKIAILEQARARTAVPLTPLQALAEYGGAEIAAMVGAFLAAGTAQKLILIDGFIASTAFAVACELQPNLLEYGLFCHQSAEHGHRLILERFERKALLCMDLRLGEGTGAALALPLVQSACAMLAEMATFDSAGVSESTEPCA